jgi:hypothetical protein
MIKTEDVINEFDLIDREKYKDMLGMVNIPDFYKCIAQFSGLSIPDISDNVMKEYLVTWAENKYRFYQMLGNKTKLDMPFEYEHMRDDIRNEIANISREFPVYSYWLEEFASMKENKIKNDYNLGYSLLNKVNKYFPQYKLIGSTITHFFKSCLQSPDELVTKVASIFENQKVKATYTISIDPVDMMLASENPYDWCSCYRLELGNDGSHADGCLAAVLDTASLITYVWNNEGKFDLYDKYKFKSIKYKRMRQWIAISDKFDAIHFNAIYPGKNYDTDFEKQLRVMVEKVVATYANIEDKWKKNEDWRYDCYRQFNYGYSEYSGHRIYTQVNIDGEETRNLIVFDREIKCPCGCGNIMPGSYDSDDEDEYDNEYSYNGNGFTFENYALRHWCEYADEYCCEGCTHCCEENCRYCEYWKDAHPVCDLDTSHTCENPRRYDVDDGIVYSCEEHCHDCPVYQECHQEDEEEEKDEEPITVTINKANDAENMEWITSQVGNNIITTNSPLAKVNEDDEPVKWEISTLETNGTRLSARTNGNNLITIAPYEHNALASQIAEMTRNMNSTELLYRTDILGNWNNNAEG